MDHNALERPATSDDVERLARAGHLNTVGLERAYALVGKTPGPAIWARFIDWTLLGLGVVMSLAGVIFLIAYNWADMPHLLKLGLVALALLLLVAVSAARGLDTLSGKAALLGAATMVGGLLAVFGQVYQTGADSFQLFLTWAIMILPWVIISRWPPLWLLLLVLINLSLNFFWQQRLTYDTSALYVVGGLVNGIWLCAWEGGARTGITWMQERWFPQLTGTATFGFLLIPTIEWIVSPSSIGTTANLLGVILYTAFCILVIVYYRRNRDLFLLSVCALSLIMTVTAISVRLLDEVTGRMGSSNWLILSLIVVVATSIAVSILRQTARSWERTAS